MTVNRINKRRVPSVGFSLSLSSQTRSMKAGGYSVTYHPSTATVTLTDPNSLAVTLTGGTGIFVNTGNGNVTMATSAQPVQIFFQSTDADVVTTSAVGTLETLTSSQTYTQTGTARVLVIGGGNGGAPADSSKVGGAGGAVRSGIVALPGSTPVTVGAGGPAGGAGGATSFGPLSSSGGAQSPGGPAGGDPGGLQPWPGNAGTPGQTVISNAGWLPSFPIPSLAGGTGFSGGAIAAGGAGGGWFFSNPTGKQPTGAGGGGGRLPGTSGLWQGTRPGGTGGAGGVYLVRY